MNIIVTCGPSYEPIDQVRRITNFSTGRLGVTLANAFTDAGHRVFCLKGEQATYPEPVRAFNTIPFSTNDDLAAKLQSLRSENINAIYHAAALCDFKVANVENSSHEKLTTRKIPTRDNSQLTLMLIPTTKILPQIREWFPAAKIYGWKYELEGTREDAVQKAREQIINCQTTACILNGAAYGEGFAYVTNSNVVVPIPDTDILCGYLLYHNIVFRNPQLQEHYAGSLTFSMHLPQDEACLVALFDAAHKFDLIGQTAVSKEAIEHLLSPQLRPALRRWYKRHGFDMNPNAIDFRDKLSAEAGERFG